MQKLVESKSNIILWTRRVLLLLLMFCLTNEVKAATLQNPKIVSDANMAAGQKVTWDCVWFGSYPQTEIVDQASKCGTYGKLWKSALDCEENVSLYQELKSAEGWNAQGDITLSGQKYRRIKKSDASYAGSSSSAAEYTWTSSTDYHYFRYEPVKWRVLNISEGKALLLADKALDAKQYHTEFSATSWENCTSRNYLNANFLNNAFDTRKQAAIITSNNISDSNKDYNVSGGNNTQDKIFLLSGSEVYVTDQAAGYGFTKRDAADEARVCKSSTYAKAMGARMQPDKEGVCQGWWLRTPGYIARNTITIFNSGKVNTYGEYGSNPYYVLRPALRLDMSEKSQYRYAGQVCSDGSVNEVDEAMDEIHIIMDKTAECQVKEEFKISAEVQVKAGDFVPDATNMVWEVKEENGNEPSIGGLSVLSMSEEGKYILSAPFTFPEEGEYKVTIKTEDDSASATMLVSVKGLAKVKIYRMPVVIKRKLKDDSRFEATIQLDSEGITSKEYIDDLAHSIEWESSNRNFATIDKLEYRYANDYRKAIITVTLKYNQPGETEISGEIPLEYGGKKSSTQFKVFHNGYEAELDGWPLINMQESFGYKDNYKIPLKRYEEVYIDFSQFWSTINPFYTLGQALAGFKSFVSWDGSCFALSLTSAANYLGLIDLKSQFPHATSDYLYEYGYDAVKCTGSGKSFYEISSRKDVIDMLERVQISQYSKEFVKLEVGKGDASYSEIIDLVMNQGHTILVCAEEPGEGHTIIIDDYLCEFDGVYNFTIYDCRYPFGGELLDNPQSYYFTSAILKLDTNDGSWEIDEKKPGDDRWMLTLGNGYTDFLVHPNIRFYDMNKLTSDFFTKKKLTLSGWDITDYRVRFAFSMTADNLELADEQGTLIKIENNQIKELTKDYQCAFGDSANGNLIRYMDVDSEKISARSSGANLLFMNPSRGSSYYVSVKGKCQVDVDSEKSYVNVIPEESANVLVSMAENKNGQSEKATAIEFSLNRGEDIAFENTDDGIKVESDAQVQANVTVLEDGNTNSCNNLLLQDEVQINEELVKEEITRQEMAKRKVKSIKISGSSHEILSGKQLQLKAEVLPTDAGNKALSWSSSDPKVATVSQNGLVTALKTTDEKTVTITASAKDGSGVKASYKITVQAEIKVSEIEITGLSQKIAAGKKIQLTADVYPENATNKAITWKSSNTNIATVNQDGLVKVKKKTGKKSVVITAKAQDGSGVKASYKIKSMKYAVKKIKLSVPSTRLKAGKSMYVKAKVKVTGTSSVNKTLKWSVNKPKYASISSKGKLKAKSAGKGHHVTVTAEATDGTGIKASIKLKIK